MAHQLDSSHPPASLDLGEAHSASVTQLRYLLATTETDTWKQAAARLGVSGPAMSQGLAELERRLGIPLFDNDGRHRNLTANGRTVVEYARRIVTEYGDLSRFARSVREGSGGRLRIGMIDTAALHHFSDTLIDFKQSHRDVDFHLVVQPSSTLLEMLDRGHLDVIIGVDLPSDDRHITTTLLEEPLFIYAPIGTPSNIPTRRWGPWLTFPATSRTRRRIAQHLAGRGVVFDVVAESSQPSVLRGMVHLALGWTVLCATDAEQAPYALAPFDSQPLTTRSLTLSYRKERHLDVATTAFIAALTK